MKFLLTLAFIIGIAPHLQAADSLQMLMQRPMNAHSITTDELGNIYAIQRDNTFVRFNPQGDSTGFYRSALNGQMGTADVTNPLRILLYFPAFSRIQIVDRQLALQAEVNLRQLQILSADAVATASDGNIWVYDPIAARISKLDGTGARSLQSTDLRDLLPFVPRVQKMVERDRRLYLCDTTRGILVFDVFASYITTLPFRQVQDFDVVGHQLVYLQAGVLHRYDMQTFQEKTMSIPSGPGPVVDACLTRHSLVVLYPDTLRIYTQ